MSRPLHREPDRPARLTCACCERFVQARCRRAPSSAAARSGLAHVLVSKYADHLPLYRQSQIFDREGLDLDRSTLADWVGKPRPCWNPSLMPSAAMSCRPRRSSPTTRPSACSPRHRQDPDGPALDLCPRRTPVGRHAPPAAWYRFSGDRKGQHPKDHLARFRGWMHADGYAGFEDLYRSGAIREVACMAHVRRKFVDIHRSQGSPSPKKPSPDRATLCRREGGPRLTARRRAELRKPMPPRSSTIWRSGWPCNSPRSRANPPRCRHPLCPDPHGTPAPYLDHGILELDNNAAERGMRAIALGRKNYLFVGSEAGGKAAAIAYTLIETAKLNAVDPHAWLADTLARIPDYKITKVDDLLPWHWNG
jgi:hypothetical protein